MIYKFFILYMFLFSFVDFIKLKSQHKKILIILVVFLFLFFLGLAYRTGLDWLFYERLYYNESNTKLFIEPLYYIINIAFRNIGLSYNFFSFLVFSFFTYSIYCFYRRKGELEIFCLTSIFCVLLFFGIEAKRQVIAISIILFSFNYLYWGYKWRFIISVVIAMLFHVSAVIMFIFFIFYKARSVYKLNVTLLIVILVCSLYKIDVVEILNSLIIKNISNLLYEKLEYYIFMIKNSTDSFNINNVIKLLVFLYVNINYKKIFQYGSKVTDSKVVKIIFSGFGFYIFISLFFSGMGVMSERINVYFLPCYILIISWMISAHKYKLVKLLFYFFFICFFYISFIRSTNNEYFILNYENYRNVVLEVLHPDKNIDIKREEQVENYLRSKSIDN